MLREELTYLQHRDLRAWSHVVDTCHRFESPRYSKKAQSRAWARKIVRDRSVKELQYRVTNWFTDNNPRSLTLKSSFAQIHRLKYSSSGVFVRYGRVDLTPRALLVSKTRSNVEYLAQKNRGLLIRPLLDLWRLVFRIWNALDENLLSWFQLQAQSAL